MHTFVRDMEVAAGMGEAWKFISNPGNLNRITPENLDFRIVSPLPEKMVNGLLIEYRIKLPMLGKRTWVSEIKHIEEGRSFVDEQREGPYRFWYHYHEISPTKGGVRMADKVTYALPFGILGRAVQFLFVRQALDGIFDYREKAIRKYFA